MLDIALVYLFPLDAKEEFTANARRWAASYLEFPPGESHRVLICLTNGEPTDNDRAIFAGIDAEFTGGYEDKGWDIGAYQHMAKHHDAELMVFTNSRVRFWKAGWLRRFVAAYNQFGSNGLYGASGSYETCFPQTFPFPNPHIRTSCFATNPKVLRRFPYTVTSRDEGFKFESAEWNFMQWYEDHGYPVRVVTWDGFYDKSHWRTPQNVFRKGNQTNCLVYDRHHDLYFAATPESRQNLEMIAGNPNTVLAKKLVIA